MMELRPSEIFYSQDSILNKFGDYTRHGGTYLGETLDQLLTGQCNVNHIDRISVIDRYGRWFTADNRRLWVFRKAEEIGFLKTISVRRTFYIDDNKFTTENGGTSIRIRKGGNPGGDVWRKWKPPYHEVPTRIMSYNLNTVNMFSFNNGYRIQPIDQRNNALNRNFNNVDESVTNGRQYPQGNLLDRHGISPVSRPVSVWSTKTTTHNISRESSRESLKSFLRSNTRIQSPTRNLISSVGSHKSKRYIHPFNVSQGSSYTARSSPVQKPPLNTNDFSRIDSSLSQTSIDLPRANDGDRISRQQSFTFNSTASFTTSGISNISGLSGIASDTPTGIDKSRRNGLTKKSTKESSSINKDITERHDFHDVSWTIAKEQPERVSTVTDTSCDNTTKRNTGCCSIL